MHLHQVRHTRQALIILYRVNLRPTAFDDRRVNVLAAVFSVALIPHTLDVTTLGGRKVGETVNIETDILAKYVQRLAGGRGLDGIRLGEDAATEGQA